MSQFKRQRINPLPGGRNFSGAYLLTGLHSVYALDSVSKNMALGCFLKCLSSWLESRPLGLQDPLTILVLRVVGAVPGDCSSVPIGAASTSLLGPPPGLLTPPVATDLSQNARHLQVCWVPFLVSFPLGPPWYVWMSGMCCFLCYNG